MFLRLQLPHFLHVGLPHHHDAAAKTAGKPLWQSMTKFMTSLLFTNLLQSSAPTLNVIYVGHLIGTSGVAAIASFLPLLLLMVAFLAGLATGSAILIAHAYGAKDLVRVRAIAGAMIALGSVVALFISVAGFLAARSLMEMLSAPADVFEEAVTYGRFLFLLLPILFVFVIYSSFLRGTGETRIPLVVLLLNTCMVAGLTPALILGWGGIPPQGIRAAVFGSATANLLSLCGMIAYLNWHNHPLAFNREMIANVRFRWKLIREIVNIGLPTGLQMVMLSLSQIVLIVFVNRFGSDATAAFGAALQISGFAQLPSVAVALTASIFAAQMIGAGDPSRVGTITRVAVILNYVAGGIVMFFVYIFAPHLLGLFLKTPVALKIGLELTYISMWSYLVYGHAEILTGVMRSYRVVWTPMLIEVAALWLFEVPFAWYFSQQFGLTGIWWAYPTSNVAVLAAEIAFVTLYWRRKRRA